MPTSTTSFKPVAPDDWKIRLQRVLDEQGLSQRELARRCGLGPTSVLHSLRSGSDVRLSTIYLYAQNLGVSPHWLAFGPRITKP